MSKSPVDSPKILALLAGQGTLPATVAADAQAQGFTVHVISFQGQPQPQNLPKVASHTVLPLGAAGRALSHLKHIGATHVCLAGGINKPSLFAMKPDLTALKILGKVKVWHDDALLRAITGFLAKEGLTVCSVTRFTPQLLAPLGTLTKTKLPKAMQPDVTLALEAFRQLAPLDLGQALVVHRGVILGVEGPEGTDALIARCAALRGPLKEGEKAGLLVKLAKPHQTKLADLPAVGPDTVHILAQHHYAGLVVQAGATLILQKEATVAQANTARLILHSLTPPWQKK